MNWDNIINYEICEVRVGRSMGCVCYVVVEVVIGTVVVYIYNCSVMDVGGPPLFMLEQQLCEF